MYRLFCKCFGILCILAASVLAGMECEKRLKRRWLLLREITEILDFLEKEMVCHRIPMREAFADAAERCRNGFGSVLLFAGEQMGKRGGTSFGEIWSEAVHSGRLQELLSGAEYQKVLELGGAFGSVDTVMQETLLKTCRERFAGMSREAEERYREKGALYRKLAAAAGVFLVLLLI